MTDFLPARTASAIDSMLAIDTIEELFPEKDLADLEAEQLVDLEATPALVAQLTEECRRLLDLLSDETLRSVALWKMEEYTNAEIARKLGLTIEDLKEHIEIIRHLDPKPGSRYNPTQSQYVIPDVYVIKVEDQYVAVLNES